MADETRQVALPGGEVFELVLEEDSVSVFRKGETKRIGLLSCAGKSARRITSGQMLVSRSEKRAGSEFVRLRSSAVAVSASRALFRFEDAVKRTNFGLGS